MFKRLLLVVITLCCLASMPGVGIPEELRLPPGKTSFPPEVLAKLGAQFPEKPSLPADLAALTASYPGFCLGLEVRQDRKVYLIMKNQVKILYDDGLVKSFEDKLKRPDLKDMLAQVYRPGRGQEPFRPDYDPGRFRVDAWFSAVYGASASEVGGNLVPVPFCGVRVRFNAQNGAARELENVGRELAALLAKRPQLRQYLFPLGGTFSWRPIAGTNRLSPHSWGIAIDLNPRHGAYWRDRQKTGPEVEAMRNSYPQEIVELFEKHGFIWGGKWSLFDLMHFEYRPEMLKKWQLSRGAGSGG
ncbi:MAG: M15 family metallopeptidase [Deltaproteobacteria bacterium]|nr:M15 family metallopeptidase [Deltaproteobacteria bacterium]